MSVAIFAGVALFLFAGSFFSKRRFGLLGLALAAGYILSTLWQDTAEFMISATGFVPAGVVSHFVATLALLLIPPTLLFFHGYAYKSLAGRLIGSILFTALALAFIIEPMGKALVLEGPGVPLFNWFTDNADFIIGVGLIFAVFDVFFSKPASIAGRSKR